MLKIYIELNIIAVDSKINFLINSTLRPSVLTEITRQPRS